MTEPKLMTPEERLRRAIYSVSPGLSQLDAHRLVNAVLPVFDAQRARPDAGLREALDALADVKDEDAEDACGPLMVVYDDYMGGHEADGWCDRPNGHAGPHLAREDWQKFARLASQVREQE